ncbi:MAG TPA: hypothetical protein VI037_01435 [Nitrososphaera sp.]
MEVCISFYPMKNPRLCKVTSPKILCRPTAEEMMYFINDQPNAGTVQVKEQRAKNVCVLIMALPLGEDLGLIGIRVRTGPSQFRFSICLWRL